MNGKKRSVLTKEVEIPSEVMTRQKNGLTTMMAWMHRNTDHPYRFVIDSDTDTFYLRAQPTDVIMFRLRFGF